MIDQLPYTITKGVTATRKGLVFDGVSYATHIMHPAMSVWPEWDTQYGEYFLSWPDAAERLRYREEEPWCYYFDRNIVCGRPGVPELVVQIKYTLHRLAALLCDDAEAFRVLHACIEEFGDE